MTTPIEWTDHDVVHVLAQLYLGAAQELLHAYQRNKEATRHNERRAFRAALHCARLSCRHSHAAHEYLLSALEHYTRLAGADALLPHSDADDHPAAPDH